MGEVRRGAYGIGLAGAAATHPSLPVAHADWPVWSIAWSQDALSGPAVERYPLPDGGTVSVNAVSRSAVVSGLPEPSVAAILHPWLSFVATVVSHQRGFATFHAGAFVHRGRAWAVLGEKHAGKTSTLAWLSQNGTVVTSDDLVVLDGSTSLSGPGCLDLRRPTAEHLGLGERNTPMPGRERWRLWLPPPPATHPLAGFLLPAWGERSAVAAVPPRQRIEEVVRHRAYLAPEGGEARLLALAGLPMLRWTRPKDFTALPEAVAVMRTGLDGAAAR